MSATWRGCWKARPSRAGWAKEEAAFDEGDFDAAAEATLKMWVDGPGRSPADVDPEVRLAVRTMILRSYELQPHAEEAGAEEEEILAATLAGLLGEIRCPTLVIVGDEDIADMRAIAAHVAGSIVGARLVNVPDAAHLPGLERAEEVNALLLAFLAEAA